MSFRLNSLKGVYRGSYRVPILGLIKGDTRSLDRLSPWHALRSLDYSSNRESPWFGVLGSACSVRLFVLRGCSRVHGESNPMGFAQQMQHHLTNLAMATMRTDLDKAIRVRIWHHEHAELGFILAITIIALVYAPTQTPEAERDVVPF